MIPHEREMVERLKDQPFALIGINSDGDRDVSSKLEEKEKTAIAALGGSVDGILEKIRDGDAETLAKVQKVAPTVPDKIRQADRANLKKILEKNDITWKQAVEGSTRGPLPTRWNVQGWPTIYVLDAKGVIRFRDLRDAELEEAVMKLLEEMKGEGGR